MDDIRKRYNELKNKHKLPKFEVLEEFQISSLEETNFLLQGIRDKISERLQDSTDFLSDVLNPDSNIANMYESRVFDQDEKNEAFEVFRRLMFWHRSAFEVSIIHDDASVAQFIVDFCQEWQDLKSRFLKIVVKVRNSWVTDSEQTEKLGYFG